MSLLATNPGLLAPGWYERRLWRQRKGWQGRASMPCTSVERLTVPMPTVITTMVPAVISITPVSGSAPAATGPYPMVIAPSPASTNPDVPRGGADRHCFNNRCRHWRLYNDRRQGHHNRHRSRYDRDRNRNSNIETDMHPSVCRGESQSSQGQHCDSLFHSYRFDALDEKNMLTNGLPFCNSTDPNRSGRRLA